MKTIKIVKNIYLGLLSTVILLLVIFLLCSLFSKRGYTVMFGYSFFEVKSYSMYPELDKGDLVIVKKRAADEYEVGMIVTYMRENDDIPTTHKIVKIEGNVITTRGINEETNISDDEPFDVSNIIGEVTGVWRNYSNVRSFVTSPLGFIVIILLGFLIIEGFALLEDYFKDKEIQKLKKELEIE